MTHLHYLYPSPPLHRLTPLYNDDGTMNRPGLAWDKMRLWPIPERWQDVERRGPNAPTKAEDRAHSEILWREYQKVIDKEVAAAKERCKTMTIPEAWKLLQSYLCTNEYETEAMSEADIEIYLYAKQLVDNHIKITAS